MPTLVRLFFFFLRLTISTRSSSISLPSFRLDNHHPLPLPTRRYSSFASLSQHYLHSHLNLFHTVPLPSQQPSLSLSSQLLLLNPSPDDHRPSSSPASSSSFLLLATSLSTHPNSLHTGPATCSNGLSSTQTTQHDRRIPHHPPQTSSLPIRISTRYPLRRSQSPPSNLSKD